MMNETEIMMHDCFPLFKKGFEIGEREGRERMTQNILDFIHEKSHFGKCEITIDDVLKLHRSLDTTEN